MDGDLYQLPQNFAAFAANGWEIEKDDREKPIQYGQYARTSMSKDGYSVDISIENYGMDIQPIENCHINVLSVTRENYGDKKTPEIFLADDISLDSSIDDVIDFFGKPTDSDDSGSTLHFYSYEITPNPDRGYERVLVRINVDSEDLKKLYEIEIRNDYDVPEDIAADKEYDGAVPDYVKNYKKPSKLGSNWDDFTLEIEGEYYQLPIPLATLLEDGWEVRDTGALSQNYDASVLNQIIPAKTGVSTLGGLKLMNKKDKGFSVDLFNYADVGQPLRNCMVIGVKMYIYSNDDAHADMAFPGKIGLSSSIEDVEKAYGKPDTLDDSSQYSINVLYGKIYNDEFRFDWNKEDKMISYLTYHYEPKELD